MVQSFASELSIPPKLMVPPALPDVPFEYSINLPDHLVELTKYSTEPPDNQLTDHGAALGRVLFYDRALSKNFLVSCASCHSQETGFDDPNRLSIGFKGRVTNFHSLGLAFAGYNSNGRYFRDEHAASLEEQVLEPIHDPTEMGLGKGELTKRIQSRDWYEELFRNAFGSKEINERRIAKALSQFVRSMTAANAPYDIARKKVSDRLEPFPDFSDLQNEGKRLFLATRKKGGFGCSGCHETEAFIMLSRHNNGLDPFAGVSGKNSRFRGASLRNVSVRAPYMHDGRFSTIDEVLEHYSTGVNPHPELEPPLVDEGGNPVRLQLTENQRKALVSFLETLTDETFLADPKFSNPFASIGAQ